jgi:hypothetical protein
MLETVALVSGVLVMLVLLVGVMLLGVAALSPSDEGEGQSASDPATAPDSPHGSTEKR